MYTHTHTHTVQNLTVRYTTYCDMFRYSHAVNESANSNIVTFHQISLDTPGLIQPLYFLQFFTLCPAEN